MTAEEWKFVEERLNSFYIVDLLIDGYKVQLTTVREGMKLYIQIFINGKCKFEWLTNDCEERRRFMFKSKRCAVSLKDKKEMKLTDKEYKKLRAKYTSYYYFPYFSSFKSLKSQLTKNNKSIELI